MEINHIIGIITGSLSLLGCFYIISTIVLFKDLWVYNFRLILYLAISNIILSIAFIIPNNTSGFCTVQGFMDNFGSLSSLLWTSCIFYSIYRLIVFEEQGTSRLEIIFSICCWGISTGLSLFGIASYTKAEGWCWIQNGVEKMLIMFYGPYFLVLFFDIFICIKIFLYLKRYKDENSIKVAKMNAFKKFALYPVALFIVYLPLVVHRFYRTFTKNDSPEWLNILGVISNAGYGLVCALIYGLNKFVRSKIFSALRIEDRSKKVSMVVKDSFI